jgi:hypothetical protein
MNPKRGAKAYTLLPVTPTEEEILKTLSTYRYMTALDVAYSLFSPKSLTHVRSILTRLSGGMDYKERECLYRFPWPTGKAGNPERIFTLGAAGREIVQRLGIPVTWYYRPSKTGRLNSSYLAHQLLVTRFVICACRFTSEQPDYTLADVRLCYDLERSLGNRAGEAVVPDAWLHFERISDGVRFPVLVEIDRGSEFQERFKNHVRGRLEFIRSGDYARSCRGYRYPHRHCDRCRAWCHWWSSCRLLRPVRGDPGCAAVQPVHELLRVRDPTFTEHHEEVDIARLNRRDLAVVTEEHQCVIDPG